MPMLTMPTTPADVAKLVLMLALLGGAVLVAGKLVTTAAGKVASAY